MLKLGDRRDSQTYWATHSMLRQNDPPQLYLDITPVRAYWGYVEPDEVIVNFDEQGSVLNIECISPEADITSQISGKDTIDFPDGLSVTVDIDGDDYDLNIIVTAPDGYHLIINEWEFDNYTGAYQFAIDVVADS